MFDGLSTQEFWMALLGAVAVLLQLLLTLAVILRVILTRHPPGSSFAWILLTTILPYIGFVLYVWLGERPIGKWRARRLRHLLKHWEKVTDAGYAQPGIVPQTQHAQRHKGLARLAERLGDMPMSCGSELTLLPDSIEALSRIYSDINNAKKSVSMEFYIWGVGGWCDKIAQAVIDATKRGCLCRILVDDIGSRTWLRTNWPAKMLAAGVHVSRALPVSLLPRTKGRADLRLHRKNVIIDERIGYTGSLNLIDPEIFHTTEGVGEWIDAMVRVEGCAVRDLNQIFLFDWALQPDIEGERITLEKIPPVPAVGSACVTVVPSGPTTVDDANQRLILEAIGCARECIYVTTPYFIPGETLILALQNAAMRGVDVHICIPQNPDSQFVRWASRRYFSDLMSAGVKLTFFTEGLLHTKAITVDNTFSLFGTVNLDKRSLHLNFEMMMLIFDSKFVNDMTVLHRYYESRSMPIDPSHWHNRSLWERFLEGLSYLLSPLL